MASRQCISRSQLSEQTNFDRTLVGYLIKGLVSNGLIKACNEENGDLTYYELTERGMASIEEYERSNPALIINRLID